MGKDLKKIELFETAHMMILIAYTVLSAVLIVESFVMSWEWWPLILITSAVIASWWLHIRHSLTEGARLWVYSLLTMATFFYYGTHITSTFDTAAVMTAVMILYIMTGNRKLIYLCQVTYFVTMAYDLIILLYSDTVFDKLMISRVILHIILILLAGWFARTIIDKWIGMSSESDKEIEFLTDATRRLDDFLANVSHEIRTPINAVVGLTGVCIENETDAGKIASLNAINEAGKRVAVQVNDILDYSEIDRRMLVRNDEEYMLDSLLQDLVTQLRPYKKPDIELIIDVDPAIPAVMSTDVNKLKRILWHLIMNGLKYTNEGGVYVRITSVEEDYGINLNIEVTDTGIGMNEEELERITEGFYQADSGRSRMGGGLGLGIPIVMGFVSVLSGFVAIDSTPGVGTTVRVSIPQKVIDGTGCMSLGNRERLCLGAYLHFDKYKDPNIREYYSRMVGNMVRGLGVQMHWVENADNLKRLVSSVSMTHLFIAVEEYLSAPDYIEQLAKKMVVVIVADAGFELPEGSGLMVLEKPFYCFPVAVILNKGTNEKEADVKMLCPGVEALVVDDEPMNLIVAKGIFNRYEMNVTTVESGPEAIEICRQKKFDIIFMDHMMPGMDGVETVKRLKSDRTHLSVDAPIVALTANAVSTAREMFMTSGFDGFVSKPVEISELERVLKKVLPKSSVVFREIAHSGAKGVLNVRERLKEAGFDVDRGLSYLQGDEDLYITLLVQFVKDAVVKRNRLMEYYMNGDNKNYEIVVHALKSTARTIGAFALADSAKELEDLSGLGDGRLPRELHGRMLKRYEDTVRDIKRILESDSVITDTGSAGPHDGPGQSGKQQDEQIVFEFAPTEKGGSEG